MREYLLGNSGRFYKANLHCHSTLSDGSLSPEELKWEYISRGYSIIAFTDHDKYIRHPTLNDNDFIALGGMEVSINDTLGRTPKTYHFNLIDKNPSAENEVPLPSAAYGDMDAINEYILRMKNEGFLVTYNHPYWSMQTYDDYKNLKNCFAMEIYNHGCEMDGLYGYSPQVYDEMLRTGQRLYCLATDDNHNRSLLTSSKCDSFGGYTMIESEELSYGSIINSLETGRFYASFGPTIEQLYMEDGHLCVETSPVAKIYVITQTRRCYSSHADIDGTITYAKFKLTGDEGYIRVDCRDEHGRHALSHAYFTGNP